jgi:hypothetical protein
MVRIHQSDKHIGGEIYLSASSYLNKRYLSDTLTVAMVVNRSIDIFRNYLDFSKDVKVRIAPLRGRDEGRCSERGVIELDCRLSWSKALEVLAHELVHAEQYHQGRLKHRMSKGRWMHYWMGSRSFGKGTTYRAYRKQPWEIEAWGRQAELAEKVCVELEKLYPEKLHP